MAENKNERLARATINGLIQYAAERRLGFEAHQVGNIAINPERREYRTRSLITSLAEYYGFGSESQTLVNAFDERLDAARNSFGIEILSNTEQRETVKGLLGYAHAIAGDQLAAEHVDQRKQLLAVSDHFEDMASCLSWDVSALGLYQARDWMEQALPKLTALENILFTRILLGSEKGPNASGFVGGSVINPEDIAMTKLFDDLSGQYPGIKEWPALCTVYRGGYANGNPHNATELDLDIMRRYGDAFVELEAVTVCRYPTEIAVPRELRLLRHGAEIEEKTEQMLAEYAASKDLEFDCGALELEYREKGSPVPDSAAIKAEVLAGAKETIRFRLECEAAGHELVDHADAENGRGTVECERCGFSWDYQW